MPHKKTKLSCKQTTANSVAKLLSCYTNNTHLINPKNLLCIEKRNLTNIYYLKPNKPQHIHNILAKVNTQKIITIGIQIAIVKKRRIHPTLGLLTLLKTNKTQPENHYAIVTGKAAELFTYGRDILQQSILSIKINKKCKEHPLIILTTNMEPIGYGTPYTTNDRILIQNILDIGWYLRSGA